MSASIYWKPLTDGVPLHVGGSPSTFIQNIEKVFGSFPMNLNRADIPKLEVLAALYGNDHDNPYTELIGILENNDTIEIGATH